MKWYLLLLSIFVIACQQSPKHEGKTIYLMLSVDWEGDTLREKNLAALREFNHDYPQYPVIHFLNPAYYTKNNFMDSETINQKVRSVLKPNDEIGLHIHAWENLIRSAGVKFREGPSFWGEKSLGRGGEKGDDVPLDIYGEAELKKIVGHSLQLLKRNGFSNIHSFRAGGWISGPKVQKALLAHQITVDSSAVPPELIGNLYPDTNLLRFNKKLWSQTTIYSEPVRQQISRQTIVQFPNNIGLADYVSSEDFFKTYRKIMTQAEQAGKDHIYLHFGWHQESAVEYFEHQKDGTQKLVAAHFLKRVRKAIERLSAHAADHGHKIVPVTFSSYPQQLITEP